MTEQTYDQVQSSAIQSLDEALPEGFSGKEFRRQLAADAVRENMAEMERAGAILKLTEEEIRILLSFRRFKATAKKPGEVFKWRTRPMDEDIVVVDRAHIRDPQDVSAH